MTTSHFTTLNDFTAMLSAFELSAHHLVPTNWQEPSPCLEWTRADVVRHVIDTQSLFFTNHQLTIEPATDPNPADAFTEHITRVVPLAKQHWHKNIEGFFGPSTIGQTISDFYLFDLLIHRWDMTAFTDHETHFTPTELTWLTAKMDDYGDVMYTQGMFAPPVHVAGEANEQSRVLARTGRANTQKNHSAKNCAKY